MPSFCVWLSGSIGQKAAQDVDQLAFVVLYMIQVATHDNSDLAELVQATLAPSSKEVGIKHLGCMGQLKFCL